MEHRWWKNTLTTYDGFFRWIQQNRRNSHLRIFLYWNCRIKNNERSSIRNRQGPLCKSNRWIELIAQLCSNDHAYYSYRYSLSVIFSECYVHFTIAKEKKAIITFKPSRLFPLTFFPLPFTSEDTFRALQDRIYYYLRTKHRNNNFLPFCLYSFFLYCIVSVRFYISFLFIL